MLPLELVWVSTLEMGWGPPLDLTTLGAAAEDNFGDAVGTTLGAAVGTTLGAEAGVGGTFGGAHGDGAGVGTLFGGSIGWTVVAPVALHFTKSAWMLERASSWALHVMEGRSTRAQVIMERAWVMRLAGVRDG